MSMQVTSDSADAQRLRAHAKQLKELAKETHFNDEEVHALVVIYYRFLNEGDEKRLHMERAQLRSIFHSIFEINDDFLIERALVYLDKGSTGSSHVSIETWLRIMSLFLRGTLEEKMEYCFSLYDLNSDRAIKRNEVILMLGKCFITEHEEDADLATKDLADIIVRKMDLDNDGIISFEDYRNSVLKQPELLETFGRCLPERACAFSFMQTFTSENLRF